MSAATLTASPAPRIDPSATEDPAGPILRAIASSCPDAGVAALDRLAAKQKAALGQASGLVHPHGLAAQIGNIREKAAPFRLTMARLEYLAKLQADGEKAVGTFVPPGDDAEWEAVETLRGLLGRSPASFNGLVDLVNNTLAGWRAEIAKLAGRCDPATWPANLAAVAADDRFDPVAFLDSTRGQVLRMGELSAKVESLDAARVRLGQAFGRRVQAAVKAAGGEAAVGEALRESSRLLGASGDGADAVSGLRSELAAVDAKLAKLGVDPAKGQASGLAAQALLSERSAIADRIEAATGEFASNEVAGHGSLVADVLAFSPLAWSKILAFCQAEPSAFVAGFEASWSKIPLDSLVEAGARDFVEPFEAQ